MGVKIVPSIKLPSFTLELFTKQLNYSFTCRKTTFSSS